MISDGGESYNLFFSITRKIGDREHACSKMRNFSEPNNLILKLCFEKYVITPDVSFWGLIRRERELF